MEHELLRKLDIGFGGREKAALEQIRNRARDGSAIASEVACGPTEIQSFAPTAIRTRHSFAGGNRSLL